MNLEERGHETNFLGKKEVLTFVEVEPLKERTKYVLHVVFWLHASTNITRFLSKTKMQEPLPIGASTPTHKLSAAFEDPSAFLCTFLSTSISESIFQLSKTSTTAATQNRDPERRTRLVTQFLTFYSYAVKSITA